MQPTRAVINDQNEELINCYEVVRDSLDDLIEELREHEKHNNADYFYEIRDLDRSPENYKSLSAVKRAARIIYLNKTCYNGLFRVNSQGQFNVPFGRYKKPNILDEAVLKHLKPKTVVTATRVEPPLHPDGKEKVVHDFGSEIEDFDYNKFCDWTSEYEPKHGIPTTEGVFAPWCMYKEDFLNSNISKKLTIGNPKNFSKNTIIVGFTKEMV